MPAEIWTYVAAGGTPINCTASWDGNMTLVDTVTSTGQVIATFSGQALKGLGGIPLPAMSYGNPS